MSRATSSKWLCLHRSIRLPAKPLRIRLYAHEILIGRNVKDRTIVTPTAIGGRYASRQRAEVLAFGREHDDAARSRRPQVPVLVDLESIGKSRLLVLHPF